MSVGVAVRTGITPTTPVISQASDSGSRRLPRWASLAMLLSVALIVGVVGWQPRHPAAKRLPAASPKT